MKNRNLFLTLLMLCGVVWQSWGQIIISQYYEGSSFDKWIEITNVGSSSVNLSTYNLCRWANTGSPSGSGSCNALSGNLAAGASILFKNSQATNPTYATGTDASAVNFNGNDPMAITQNGTNWSDRVDVIYQTGTWGGNTSFYRKANVLSGNTGISTLDGTGEWEEVSNSTVDNASAGNTERLGDHTFNSGGPSDPGSFSASASSQSQIDLTFTTNANSDNVVIVHNTTGTFTAPTAAPTVGDPLAGGTVLSNGTTSPVSHTGLTSGQQVYYTAFSYDGTDYSSGLTDDATTLKPEPDNHVTGFLATANGSSQIDLSWSDNNGTPAADGFLIVGKTGSASFASPTDGTEISDDTDWSDDEFEVNANPGDESYTVTGLDPSTSYDFEIYPYTNSGSNIDYKTSPAAPAANETTGAAGTGQALPYSFDFTTNPFANGWIAEDVQQSNSVWTYVTGTPQGAQMNAFSGGGCEDNEDWLITPAFDLNSSSNELLSIDFNENFSGTDLDILYSTNYSGTGNPNNATWTVITTYTSGSTGNISNNTGLQGVSGTNVYVAIRYVRSGGTQFNCSEWTVTDFSLTAPTTKAEPTNHVTSFTATANGSSQIDLSWSDNNGTPAADGFLIVGKTGSASFASPTDGTEISDDIDWSDDEFEVNVNPGVGSYSVTGLDPSTSYDFEIYPYTNAGSNIDYKTSPAAPSTNASTNAPSSLSVIVNEMSQGSGGSKEWMEIVVIQDNLDITGWEVGDNDDGSFSSFVTFSNDPEWQNVRSGTVIAIYNGSDVDGTITPDVSFSDYQVAIASNNTTYFSGSWGSFGNSDDDDAAAIRDDAGNMIHDMAATHPNATISGPSGGEVTFYTGNTAFQSDLEDPSNWSTQNSTNGTPGAPNGGANSTWINGLQPAVTLKAEPTNHVNSFTATANGFSQVDLSWTDNNGTVAADGFLIVGKTGSASFASVTDNNAVSDDSDWSDDNFAVNVNPGVESYSVTGLDPTTTYDFEIYPYSNAGSDIDYKTNGTVPSSSATTTAFNPPTLIITEVADPDDDFNGRFVEIYNYGNQAVDASAEQIYFARQSNGGNIASTAITQMIQPGEVIVIGNSSNINSIYGEPADIDFGSVNGNGDDGYFLYEGGDETNGTIFDAYGVLDQDGTGQGWEYENDRVTRNNPQSATPNPNWTASEWTITATQDVADMTPGTVGASFTYDGSSWSPSSPDGSAASLDEITIESGNVTFSSNTSCNNIDINPGATLTISAGQTLTVEGTATLEADASGYAQVIGEVTGNVAVQSYLDAGSARWFNVASPLNGGTVADFSVSDGSIITSADGSAGQVNIYHYDPTTPDNSVSPVQGSWIRVPNTSFSTDGHGFSLYLGGPYFGSLPITVTATGSGLANGSQSVSLSDQNQGWNFVPNPYPSAIDWDTYHGNNNSNLGANYYVDDNGVFASYDASTGTPSNGGTAYIAPMQAFFVNASSNISLSFDNADRTVSQTPPKHKNNATVLKLASEVKGTDLTDETILIFDQQYTDVLDQDKDGLKRMNYASHVPNLFTSDSVGNSYVFNKLNDQFQTKLVDLKFENDTNGVHTIRVERNSLSASWTVLLKDKLNGNLVDIISNPYDFNHTAQNNTNRFELIINQNSVSTAELNVSGIYAYCDGQQLMVNLQQLNGKAGLHLYDLQGRLVQTSNAQGGQTAAVNIAELAKGVYILKVNSNGKTVHTQKVTQ